MCGNGIELALMYRRLRLARYQSDYHAAVQSERYSILSHSVSMSVTPSAFSQLLSR